MNTQILSPNETQKILDKLEEQFGINPKTTYPEKFKFIKKGKERIFLFTGNISEEEIYKLEEMTFIEGIGNYIGTEEEFNKEIRLSIDGTQFFKEAITKNIIVLNSEEQVKDWMEGKEIILDNLSQNMSGTQKGGVGTLNNLETGFVVIQDAKSKDFLGCGKYSSHLNKVTNFVPKNRRLKERT